MYPVVVAELGPLLGGGSLAGVSLQNVHPVTQRSHLRNIPVSICKKVIS